MPVYILQGDASDITSHTEVTESKELETNDDISLEEKGSTLEVEKSGGGNDQRKNTDSKPQASQKSNTPAQSSKSKRKARNKGRSKTARAGSPGDDNSLVVSVQSETQQASSQIQVDKNLKTQLNDSVIEQTDHSELSKTENSQSITDPVEVDQLKVKEPAVEGDNQTEASTPNDNSEQLVDPPVEPATTGDPHANDSPSTSTDEISQAGHGGSGLEHNAIETKELKTPSDSSSAGTEVKSPIQPVRNSEQESVLEKLSRVGEQVCFSYCYYE